jgi:ribonuclease VapC
VIIDTSAVIAIVHREPEASEYIRIIGRARPRRISAASYLESAIVVDTRQDPAASRRFDEFMASSGISIEPMTKEQAEVARAAYRDYGKGSGHPAKLNFGDCFAYALASVTNEPLLFKGNDFGHTDIHPVL